MGLTTERRQGHSRILVLHSGLDLNDDGGLSTDIIYQQMELDLAAEQPLLEQPSNLPSQNKSRLPPLFPPAKLDRTPIRVSSLRSPASAVQDIPFHTTIWGKSYHHFPHGKCEANICINVVVWLEFLFLDPLHKLSVFLD
jgi:hypothetical protein